MWLHKCITPVQTVMKIMTEIDSIDQRMIVVIPMFLLLRAGPYYFIWPLWFCLLATKECKSKHFTVLIYIFY